MKPKHFSARVVEVFNAAALPPGLHFRAAADDAPAEILIYDAIGDDGWGGGVSASAVAGALKQAAGGAVDVRLNSPGGSAFDGVAIYNMLLAHPGVVTCFVDGLAASAASVIACGGSRLVMAESAMLMIHNASTVVYGDRNAMAETGAVLGKVDGQMVGIYASKTGGSAEDFATLMDAETWMTAAEAKTAGLCDEVVAPSNDRRKPAAAADGDLEKRRARVRLAMADLAASSA